jgi:hypothetical protein
MAKIVILKKNTLNSLSESQLYGIRAYFSANQKLENRGFSKIKTENRSYLKVPVFTNLR